MKKSFPWLICVCALVACAAPILHPTETPFPTITAETSTPATLTKTPVPSPSPTQTISCAEPFQVPEPTNATLLNASAQQAQTFAQQIFEQIKSICPDFSDDFNDLVLSKTEKGWDWNSYIHEVTLEPGAVYLRPTPKVQWVGFGNPDLLQALNFVLEFKIAPKVDNNISARFTVHWRGDSYCSPVLVFWPNRQYWDISDCINTDGFMSGSGLTREILGDQPIKVLLVQSGKYVAIYINDKPFGFFHTSGVRPYIGFSAATDQQKTEFAIDYVKLWKLPRDSQISLPKEITLPEVSNRPDLSKVPPIPGSFGISVHFLSPEFEEVHLLRDAGFLNSKCDMSWNLRQTGKNTFDFASTDICFENFARENIGVTFGLGGHPTYQVPGFPYPRSFSPPVTDEARQAYVKFLEAVTSRYKNKGIIWETWGEPHRSNSWPNPRPKDYVDFLSVIIPVVRKNDPSGLIVAPGIDMLDDPFALSYIRAIGDAGLIPQLDAISVAPYKTGGVSPGNTGKPEDAQQAYLNIRKIVDSYSPNRQIPIVSTEWGYDAATVGHEKQSKFLVRMMLSNMANDIPLSYWYDWRTYSFTNNEYVYQGLDWGITDAELKPLPGFYAIKTLATFLNGFELIRCIPANSSSDYILLFRKDKQAGLAIWTTTTPHTITIHIDCDAPNVIDMLGNPYQVEINESSLTVTISDAPTYILCQDDAPAELIFWKPVHTIQSISHAKPNVLVEISNSSDIAIIGKFVLKSKLFADSEVQVSLAPGQSTTVEIPVPIKEWRASIMPVQVDFVSENGSVQSAMLWLSIIQGK